MPNIAQDPNLIARLREFLLRTNRFFMSNHEVREVTAGRFDAVPIRTGYRIVLHKAA
jgi:hypothetical protein